MMIEEKIAHSILHQQKDVITRHLNQIQEALQEDFNKEDLIVHNESSPFFGKVGVEIRLRYDKRCRSWDLYHGLQSPKEPWHNWVAHGFLCYEDGDLNDLACELVECVIQDAVEEYQNEYC